MVRMETLNEQRTSSVFDEHAVLHDLKHYLPAQAPLKDFIHHNTLHAFQHERFHEALVKASSIFGYKVYLTVNEYRKLFREGRIKPAVLDRVIAGHHGIDKLHAWKQRLLEKPYNHSSVPRIGSLRAHWKRDRRIDLDAITHTLLFRVLNSYLDQGIAIWRFPVWDKGFLASVRELQRHAWSGLLRGKRATELLLDESTSIPQLLGILVGDEALFADYLFDQQFAHSGWSGLVSVIEDQPGALLDQRRISLKELIIFELLLEVDALERQFPKGWLPLAEGMRHKPRPLFDPVPRLDLDEAQALWQEAFEWSWYDELLAGIQMSSGAPKPEHPSAQGIFCIDDRECSLRRHLEHLNHGFDTYGTAGFFGVEFHYKPEHGKFHTKVAPAPVQPKHMIKEVDKRHKFAREVHFTRHTHGLIAGWLITHTLGFWSALKLFVSIFRPSSTPGTSDSFQHMDAFASLTVQHCGVFEDGLQVGFTVDEMVARVENTLRSIGLVKGFAPVVYVVGHGASSVNNPHYAAYDCGACSGRPGSVNARVFSQMANHPEVRNALRERGIDIPYTSRFLGALHDTTRDEIVFYDEALLAGEQVHAHERNKRTFTGALERNAKERSRRFISIDSTQPGETVHERVRRRSVSLFEPRPELNHATNAAAIVGRRSLTRGLFMDRRAFLNSYDPEIDPEGERLLGILNAVAPVCGGINLEYYFSRVDNQKLGAGTKLPHNVMGLIGVANGIEGDLRPGLPSQMIEVHDPLRLLVVVEQDPDVVLRTIRKVAATYEWFANDWVQLVAIHPRRRTMHRFVGGAFRPFEPLTNEMPVAVDVLPIVERIEDNAPLTLIEA
ncbi:MAG TPA: DUF2309 domain-containing protein [Flavobacteriales bacterium]|nr:DUF2309 domain-containing protein [Flavobacteriales bacterium]